MEDRPFISPLFRYVFRESAGVFALRNELTGRNLELPTELNSTFMSFLANPKTISYYKNLADYLDELGLIYADEYNCQRKCSEYMKSSMPNAPHVEQVELTNTCPFHCVMCPRPKKMTRSIGFIDIELFEKICRVVSTNQRFLSLHHFGESLLHPKLTTLIQVAYRYGLHTGISCNAVCLNDKLIGELIGSGLSTITFNLDSFNTNTYRAIRGTHHTAEKNLQAITTFAELNRHQPKPCLVSIQMIGMRSNRNEWERILSWAKQVGLDRALVVQFGQWDFSDKEAQQLADLGTRELYNVPCNMRWESVSILWDGTVVPCCRDYNGDLPMGNVANSSLEKIWCTSLYEKLRVDQIGFKRCRACWQSWPYRVSKRIEIGFESFHKGTSCSTDTVFEWVVDGALARYKSIGFPVKFRVARQKDNEQ